MVRGVLSLKRLKPTLHFHVTFAFEDHPLNSGAYTLPDAARLLGIPLSRLRSWIRGTAQDDSRRLPAGPFASRSEGRDRHVDFFTLIELYTIAHLRNAGLSMKTLRHCRQELGKRFSTPYPFALKGLLTDGRRLLKELGEDALLELGTGGQSAIQSVLEPFCQRIDFDTASQLAAKFFPLGREIPVVVSPTHAFGRPVIAGTNLATETIASLVRGGESIDDIACEYELPRESIEQAWRFEQRQAA